MVGRTPKRHRKTSEAGSSGGVQPLPPESQQQQPPSEASLTRSFNPPSRGSTNDTPPPTANPSRDGFEVSRTIFVSGPPPLPPSDFLDEQLFGCLDEDSWAAPGGASGRANLDDGSSFPAAAGFEIENFAMPSDLQPTSTGGPASFLTAAVQQPPSLPPSAMPSFLPMSPRSPSQSGGAASAQGGQDWSQFVHVVALCKMIRLLENHVQVKSMAVDEVMRLSQACIRDITKISSKKEYMQCRSCPALISTIMELIVTMYEDTTSGQAEASQPSPASSKPNAPFLQFGVFELDPEEQTAIRNRIIRKEAQECVKIIQRLTRLLEGEISLSDKASSQPQALRNWYEGMEKRMTDLISSLTPSS